MHPYVITTHNSPRSTISICLIGQRSSPRDLDLRGKMDKPPPPQVYGDSIDVEIARPGIRE